MNKNIKNDRYQSSFTTSSTLNLGLSPTSTTECFSTDNLSSLITLPPPNVTNFKYIKNTNPVNKPKSYFNYYYKLPPIRKLTIPDVDINLPSIHRLIGSKPTDQLRHRTPYQPKSTINVNEPRRYQKSRTDQSSNKGNLGIIVIANSINKRPRRKYNEIDRKYTCTFPNCDKAYGALNHLNSHIVFSNHGSKRKAKEFR